MHKITLHTRVLKRWLLMFCIPLFEGSGMPTFKIEIYEALALVQFWLDT